MPAWTMSSETSTESQLSGGDLRTSGSDALQPWQLFTLAGLVGATITVFLSRGESPAGVIFLSLTVFAAAAVGIAALRTVRPLTAKAAADSTQVLGGRTRAALEREKALVLRSIKELEFDRAMGKVSEKDFGEMSARLRARAAGLMRQLDAGAGYREQIEKEIEKRLGKATRCCGRVCSRAARATTPTRASARDAERRSHDQGFGRWALGLGPCPALLIASAARAQDMPDPSLIHGRAIPASGAAATAS